MKLSRLTLIVMLSILADRTAVGESVKLVFEAGFSDEFQAGNTWENVDEQSVKDYIINQVTQHFQGDHGISVSTTSGHLVAYIGRFESETGFFGLAVTGTGSFVDTSPYAEIYSNNFANWPEWQGANATVTRIGNTIAGTTNHEIGHLLNTYHSYFSTAWDPTVTGAVDFQGYPKEPGEIPEELLDDPIKHWHIMAKYPYISLEIRAIVNRFWASPSTQNIEFANEGGHDITFNNMTWGIKNRSFPLLKNVTIGSASFPRTLIIASGSYQHIMNGYWMSGYDNNSNIQKLGIIIPNISVAPDAPPGADITGYLPFIIGSGNTVNIGPNVIVTFSGTDFITVEAGGSIIGESPITFVPSDRSVRHGGQMTVNNAWAFPVLVTSVVEVSSGVTLTIDPGTIVNFNDGTTLTVKGQLIAEGTPSALITFRSINDDAPAASWGSIHIDLRGGPQAPSSIKYVHVQDANIGVLGMWANNTVVENSTFQNCKIGPYAWYTDPGSSDRMQILNNTITDNTRHGIYNYYSDPIISGNTVTGTNDPSSNYGFGIYLRSSSAIVGNNTITGSKRDGIQGYGSGAAKIYYSPSLNPLGGGNSITNNTGNGVYVTAGSVPILGWSSGTPGNNLIINNSGKELYNNTPYVVNATCNDWGGGEPLSSELFGIVFYDPWIGPNGVCDQYSALLDNPFSRFMYAMLSIIPNHLYAQGNSIADRNRQATGEFISGNYEEAVRLFKEIIRDFPDSEEAFYALILSLEAFKELGMDTEFRAYLAQLLNKKSDSKVKRFAKRLMMHSLEGSGKFSEALTVGDELLSNNPSDEELNEVLFSQGMIHAWLDESGAATQKFNEIIRRFPGTDEALFAAEQNEYFGEVGFGKKAFGSAADNILLPKKYSLSNNYPNPFNPETRIDFELPEAGLTRIVIYDIRGREVVRLIDDELSAGNHSVSWNASQMSSGVYLYKLTSGSFTKTKKMLLLK